MKLIFTLSLFMLFLMGNCSSEHPPGSDLIKIQELPDFALDAQDNEWINIPSRRLYADPLGNYPSEDDLRADFKLAWKGENLLFFITIEDDGLTADTTFPWRGDAVELFLTDAWGSENIVQFSVVTGNPEEGPAKFRINDMRKLAAPGWAEPFIDSRISHEGNTIRLELLLNYRVFGQSVETGNVNLQLYIDDSDPNGKDERNQLTWHPVGHSYINSFANYRLELTKSNNTVLPGTSRLVITDHKKIDVFVFGTHQGERITVLRNNEILKDTLSNSPDPGIPVIIDLSGSGLETSRDSVYVYVDNNYLSFHNLILSPVIYKESKSPRFEREINLFRLRDRLKMPESGATVFIGSSSVRMWTSLYRDFPELKIIHRGFGGSNSLDALMYMDEIVLPYKASSIVYYEGDNDIPSGMTEDEIITNMKEFIERVLGQDPGTKIYLLSPKPAIVRMQLWEKYLSLHSAMKNLAEEYPGVSFVDVASAMFDDSGALKKHIFSEDSLHMNQEGYEIWTRILRDSMKL